LTLRFELTTAPNKLLDASGGGVFVNLLRPAKRALIRAAASTQPFGEPSKQDQRLVSILSVLWSGTVSETTVSSFQLSLFVGLPGPQR